jgi:hypothetical protein
MAIDWIFCFLVVTAAMERMLTNKNIQLGQSGEQEVFQLGHPKYLKAKHTGN